MDYQQLVKRLYPEFSNKEMAERVNIEQMFTLIESVLPVEICLHHQILPLFLKGRHLHLGMVFVGDTAAYEYARRIIAYLNYSLVKQSISSTVLQVALSAYLKHHAADAASARLQPQPKRAADAASPVALKTSAPAASPVPQSHPKIFSPEAVEPAGSESAAAAAQPIDAAPDPSRKRDRRRKGKRPAPRPEQETYVVDSPETLDEAYLPSEIHLKNRPGNPISALSDPQLPPASGDDSAQENQPTVQVHTPPALALDIRRPELPFERLAELAPRHLLPELLGRVLVGNISRLYFEPQADRGRILWSDSGVLRSAIDPISKDQLQGVLNELKQMMQLPMALVKRTSFAELEYTYGESTVLLRVRITTSQQGENAMLQVLQGATLKLYQRQQMTRLGQEAIDAAKQVQLRVSELKNRMAASPDGSDPSMEVLADLSHILRSLGQQVGKLQRLDSPNQRPEGAASPADPAASQDAIADQSKLT